jgi:hypothetical protein
VEFIATYGHKCNPGGTQAGNVIRPLIRGQLQGRDQIERRQNWRKSFVVRDAGVLIKVPIVDNGGIRKGRDADNVERRMMKRCVFCFVIPQSWTQNDPSVRDSIADHLPDVVDDRARAVGQGFVLDPEIMLGHFTRWNHDAETRGLEFRKESEVLYVRE